MQCQPMLVVLRHVHVVVRGSGGRIVAALSFNLFVLHRPLRGFQPIGC